MSDDTRVPSSELGSRFGSRFVDPRIAVAPAQAALNVLRWRWHQHGGVFGLVGLVALVLAGAVWFGLPKNVKRAAKITIASRKFAIGPAATMAARGPTFLW